MFLFYRHPDGEQRELRYSADGIHWSDPEFSSPCGDNTTFFYNPFRGTFVFSIRSGWPMRARSYHEDADFIKAGQWSTSGDTAWLRTDDLDQFDRSLGDIPQLYDVNAVAYESIMLGAFGIFYGPQNPLCERTGMVKIIDMQLGYSRDGFHFDRPHREAFIPCSRQEGTWDQGYIHAAGGMCIVHDDELWFYYTAFSGESPKLKGGARGDKHHADRAMYAGASTGLARLRRDGFASLRASAEKRYVLTRTVTFSGAHCFVNVDSAGGAMRVALVDEKQNPIPGYSLEDSQVLSVDSCKQLVTWKSHDDLSALQGKRVRFQFELQDADLFAFWVSQKPSGESGGYVAAGGPGFSKNRDV